MRILLFALSLFILNTGFSQNIAETEIRKVLDKQVSDWNRGDIDHFMDTYWKSDSLMFIGKTGVTYGWNNTLARYKKSYPDKTQMGQLHFTIIKIQALAKDVYNVVGKWHLDRTVGNLEGHYTLLLKRIGGKWLIVQDHTS